MSTLLVHSHKGGTYKEVGGEEKGEAHNLSMANIKMLSIFFTNRGILALKWGDSTLSSLFFPGSLYRLLFFSLSTASQCTPWGQNQIDSCRSRGTYQYIGALVATPPLCSGPYIVLPHVQHHWIVGFLSGSRASASMRSGGRQTPGTSTGGTRTTLDGDILSCGGIGTGGTVLCAPIIGMVVFCRCMFSLIS
jgi:hypothetical protein